MQIQPTQLMQNTCRYRCDSTCRLCLPKATTIHKLAKTLPLAAANVTPSALGMKLELSNSTDTAGTPIAVCSRLDNRGLTFAVVHVYVQHALVLTNTKP